MLKKPCPWCNQKVSNFQVGNRPRQGKPRWYQLSNIQVCPFCSQPIRKTGKGWLGLLGFMPAFVGLTAQAHLGKDVVNVSPWMPLLYACMFAGFLVVVGFTRWGKASD
ncbi:hypothetical protein [Halopseudomonas salegens]|uniref:Uncharacterized protein n=1 Tax=Halopseudomonas salegens TaxID=1434072 RepID=A0A1H2FDH9_9GAMM|nr:hypothetical protein [Halopseudomonas salegens]SDU05411.1 hypothetical protein SAMN05216210_1475 [Halopseudomonas salegens]